MMGGGEVKNVQNCMTSLWTSPNKRFVANVLDELDSYFTVVLCSVFCSQKKIRTSKSTFFQQYFEKLFWLSFEVQS